MAQNKRRKKRKVFSPIYLTLVLIILYQFDPGSG